MKEKTKNSTPLIQYICIKVDGTGSSIFSDDKNNTLKIHGDNKKIPFSIFDHANKSEVTVLLPALVYNH